MTLWPISMKLICRNPRFPSFEQSGYNMTSPFEILDVAESATDAEIKQAYLQKVRSNPPDRDQAVFQQIQEAYETVKDENSRLNFALFNFQPADFNDLLNRAFRQETPLQPFSINDFFKLLNAGHLEKIA